jgi:hypothetical protein
MKRIITILFAIAIAIPMITELEARRRVKDPCSIRARSYYKNCLKKRKSPRRCRALYIKRKSRCKSCAQSFNRCMRKARRINNPERKSSVRISCKRSYNRCGKRALRYNR